jgi:hypothetical protein
MSRENVEIVRTPIPEVRLSDYDPARSRAIHWALLGTARVNASPPVTRR